MILTGDVLEKIKEIPDESVQCCVTSPPYWGLRDYGHNGQIGLEKTPELYVEKMVSVFQEVKRVLKKDGVLWLNLGDSYMSGGGASRHYGYNDPKYPKARNGNHVEPQAFPHKTIKPKDLTGIHWRVAFALQADGWWLRQDIIWSKPNPMPESVTDRCTKSHEYIFLMAKNARYFYDAEAIMEDSIDPESYSGRRPRNALQIIKHDPKSHAFSLRDDGKLANTGRVYEKRNKRSIWEINTGGYSGAHFATFPEEIPELCIKAGSKKGDTILDPFAGSGTTLEVAKRLDREFIGIELNEKYVKDLIEPRLENINPLFA